MYNVRNVLNGTILRAALYERVSTDEQALRGYSIAAQKDALEDYCKNKRIKIVGHYTDEGVSGSKPPLKRPALKQLMEDVEAGRIDIILFTKLDRWFRSVKEYFKVQDILEKHRVEWKTIHEDYDTTTANGRMAITIFMAIAQNEREKAAERTSAVFANKRKNKESFFGKNATPYGYTEEKDENGITRLVKDPKLEEAMQKFWDIAVKYQNINKAAKIVNLEYGIKKTSRKWMELTKKEIYTGDYKGVKGYCPAYVSKEDWTKLKDRPKIKQTKGNRVYLFTGLIECPMCKNNLAGTYCARKNKEGVRTEYRSYRCQHNRGYVCSYRNNLSELKTEDWLLKNVRKLMGDEVARVKLERTKPKPKPKTNIAALKEQLRRLEVVYMAGNKSDEEYLKEQTELKAAIKKAENESPQTIADKDLTIIENMLKKDFESIYKELSDEEKRMFWRTIIKRIYVDHNRICYVDFN